MMTAHPSPARWDYSLPTAPTSVPPHADLHQYMQFSYNDCRTQVDVWQRLVQFNKNLKPPLDLVVLGSSFYGEGGQGWKMETQIFRPSCLAFTPAVRHCPWRQLEVIVTPLSIQGFWEGQPLPELVVAQMEEAIDKELIKLREARPHDPALQHLPPTFPSRGALGLFVRKGSVSFRDVILTPIPGTK
jgi:hypothetical protein